MNTFTILSDTAASNLRELVAVRENFNQEIAEAKAVHNHAAVDVLLDRLRECNALIGMVFADSVER